MELKDHFRTILIRLKKVKNSLSTGQTYFDGLAKNVAIEKYGNKFCTIIENEGIWESIGIWDKLKEIGEGKHFLTNGSYLIFDQTSAFLTIDVNSGKNHKISKENLNLVSCNEITKVLRILGREAKF